MNEEREVHGMTNEEFRTQLKSILIIAEKCKDIPEFIEELKKLIADT